MFRQIAALLPGSSRDRIDFPLYGRDPRVPRRGQNCDCRRGREKGTVLRRRNGAEGSPLGRRAATIPTSGQVASLRMTGMGEHAALRMTDDKRKHKQNENGAAPRRRSTIISRKNEYLKNLRPRKTLFSRKLTLCLHFRIARGSIPRSHPTARRPAAPPSGSGPSAPARPCAGGRCP